MNKELRNNFLLLVPTAEDLLYLLNFYQTNSGAAKLSFPRGLRTCLKNWYDSKSPSELLELLFASKRVQEIGHALVVRQLHPKLENDDKNEIFRAAFMTYDEVKKAAETSSTMKKILKYKDLKRCKEVHQAISILKRKDYVYNMNHLPTNATHSSEAIELILPNMSINSILDNLVDFCNRRMLKTQEPLSRKICNALQNSRVALNPLKVFEIKKIVEKKLAINECPIHKTGAEAAANAVDPAKKYSNPFIINKLHGLFTQSFSGQPKTGCRFYVTVDFRKFSNRRKRFLYLYFFGKYLSILFSCRIGSLWNEGNFMLRSSSDFGVELAQE